MKSRNHIANISLSCSGPYVGATAQGPHGTIRNRDGADLKFAKSDADWLHSHFSREHYSSADTEIHRRYSNPTKTEFRSEISSVLLELCEYQSSAIWNGGGLLLAYAGHGANISGALVFPDGELSAEDFADLLANEYPQSRYRLRIDLFLDSCFASAFIARFLGRVSDIHNATLFPCTLFGAALPDESAWELNAVEGGVFTHAFRSELGVSLADPKRSDSDSLRAGGTAYITNGKQHSVEFENGDFQIHNAGQFHLDNLETISNETILAEISRVRSASLE